MIRSRVESAGLIRVEASTRQRGKCPKCGEAVTVPERSKVISFPCGASGHTIEVPEVHAGKKGKCPKCKGAITVPAGGEKPVERADAVTCSMCGRAITPADGSQEPFMECPGCGAYIETSSGATSPESGGPSPDGDEDLSEESSGATGRPAGRDRRLIVLVAAVVVAGGVVLMAVLRSSGSRPADESETPRGQREVAATDLPARPVVPVVSKEATEPKPAAGVAGTTRLQFRPVPGTKRTVQLAMKVTTSGEQDGQRQDMTNTESIEFDLEVMEPPGDGTAAIGVSLVAIRQKSEASGQVVGEYDSTEPQDKGGVLAEIYGAFPANRFTVKVSPRGEIVDSDLDGLFRAVAERRVLSEDNMLRERLKEKADQAIQRTDGRFGSRENRVLAMKKQLEEFPVFGRERITGLLSHLIVALPDKSLRIGDAWEGSLAREMGLRMPMAGTYTLTAVEQDACTIQAAGRRGEDAEPIVQESKQAKMSSRLAGSSEATLRIERRTGWLLSEEQRIRLHGEVTMTAVSPQPQESSNPISIEVTRTLTTLR